MLVAVELRCDLVDGAVRLREIRNSVSTRKTKGVRFWDAEQLLGFGVVGVGACSV